MPYDRGLLNLLTGTGGDQTNNPFLGQPNSSVQEWQAQEQPYSQYSRMFNYPMQMARPPVGAGTQFPYGWFQGTAPPGNRGELDASMQPINLQQLMFLRRLQQGV